MTYIFRGKQIPGTYMHMICTIYSKTAHNVSVRDLQEVILAHMFVR